MAQNRANIWELCTHSTPAYPGYHIDFNQGFADTVVTYRPMNFFNADACICDSTGQLLFYTNGIYIENRIHDSLLNTQDFNPGFVTDLYNSEGSGIPQAVIVLPYPGKKNEYIVFHVSGEYFLAYGQYQVQPLHLNYSVIDINLDGGLGGIIEGKKNLPAISDTVSQGRLIACKHANGRDWWVVTHKFHSDKYYKVLVSPDTVQQFEQSIGNVFTSNDIFGMAVFSPDGSHYAQLNNNDTIDLLQFDRCTGEFSNQITLAVPDTPVKLSATLSCSFSPSSRYLYVSSYRRIWQFDTWSSDINGSIMLVDSIDYYSYLYDPLFLHQLAPDGKIYISTFDTDGLDPNLHVINNPDSIAALADFVPYGFSLPPIGGNFSVPNFPNYDLGPLQGSGCDTLYLTNNDLQLPVDITIAPNPVADWLNIIYKLHDDAEFELRDLYGKKVASISLFHYFKNRMIDVSALPAGVYLASVIQKGKRVWGEKVIVMN